MRDRRKPRMRGDILKSSWPDGTGEWYVVDDDHNREYPVGLCFLSFDPSRVGQSFGLTDDCVRVPPSKVPQYALVALAKFRLSQ